MTDDTRVVMQRALDFLESGDFVYPTKLADDLRTALSQPPSAPGAVPTVTECEACFTPDVCQLRGTCDHYAAKRLRVSALDYKKLWQQACDAYDRKNRSGCVCAIDPETDAIRSPCDLHKSWRDEAIAAAQGAPGAVSAEPVTRLEVEMNLWPRLRLQGATVTLHDLFAIVAALGLLREDSAAAPQPQPARDPLTDEQIDAAQAAYMRAWMPGDSYRTFARAIEAAHGIGPAPAKDVT